MTQRLRRSHVFGKRTATGDTPPYGAELLAVPAAPSPEPPVDDADDLTIFGFPSVVGADDGAEPDPADQDELDPLVQLVTEHRADPIAGVTLVVAGVAAAASLWFPWVRGDGTTGLSLVRRSAAVAEAGVNALEGSHVWEPAVIVLGGVLLLPLGILLFLPSRTHRTVGLLALCVAILVTAGVLSRFAQAEWSWVGFERGMWCAVVVSALGILGALKAMLTIPRVTVRHRPTVRQ